MSGPDPRDPAELFDAALELPPGERGAFLDRACAGDAALRAEVEGLLAALDPARAWFADAPVAAVARDWLAHDGTLAEGTTLGAYRIVRALATGGMGMVYLAERTDDAYRQRVAIKLLRPGLGGPKMLERFRTERQVLADLQHPGIAHLVDGGTTAAGVPWLAMEYVDGVPIDEHCRAHDLSVEARLALFLEVCDAVGFAHARLVVHRDLKPGNIFVDAEGRVRLLDFGIAKVLDDAAHDAADETATEMRAFTPRYASPEQLRGERVTTATDVYSLGLVLHELLTDQPSRRMTPGTGAARHAALADTAPTRPSAAAPAKRARRLRGDLDTIVLRALAWEPARRYPTVEEFAADVRRHLEGQPVLARPDTLGYRVSRFVRRNRAVAASVVAVVLTLAAALAVTLSEYRRAVGETREAQAQAYVGSIVAAEASLLVGNVSEAARRLDAAPEALRGWEWRHLHARLDRSRRSWTAHRGGITHVAVSRDGRWIASSSVDSTVALWDAATGALVRRWDGFGDVLETVAISADGERLAAGSADGRVRLLARDGAVRELLPGGDHWANVAFSPDGRTLAAGFFSGDLATWDVASGEARGRIHAHDVLAAPVFTPDGARLVTGGGDAVVRVWDARALRLLREIRGHARRVYDLSVSADGTRLLTGSMDRTARVWSLADGRELAVFRRHRATVSAVVFHPGGARVATAASDRHCFLWDAATGAELAELHGHAGDVSALAASADGRTLVAADWNGVIKEWDWDTEDVRTFPLTHEQMVPEVRQVTFAPGGTAIAAAAEYDSLPVWPLEAGAPRVMVHVGHTTRIAYAPGGELLAGEGSGTIRVVDVAARVTARKWSAHTGAVLAIAFAPDGARLLTAGEDSTVVAWRWPTLAPERTVRVRGARIEALAWSPDGARFAGACSDGAVRLWSARDTLAPRVLAGHTGAVHAVAFLPGGARLVSAGHDGAVRLWDARTGACVATLYQGRGALFAVAVSPDGRRVVAGGGDSDVHVLDAADGREIVGLHGHEARILSLEFSRDGRSLLSSSRDGTARMWAE